ncbi:MAG: hypothetical protein IJU90_04900 [Bacteroidales bacterium]|nr:hypothetical protein [Bacteroidales bacterium]
MKKSFKVFLYMLVVAGLMSICGMTTSCASSEDAPMYRSNHSSSKVINSRLVIKGTNKNNSATYRSY